jgi:hypothetical protein
MIVRKRQDEESIQEVIDKGKIVMQDMMLQHCDCHVPQAHVFATTEDLRHIYFTLLHRLKEIVYLRCVNESPLARVRLDNSCRRSFGFRSAISLIRSAESLCYL